jgi:1,4-alpha-glucan branching enzyme
VYRAIDAGGTREAQMLAALASAEVASVPSLEASVEYRVDNEHRSLAIVQKWIDGAEDAWSWLTHLLADRPCSITEDITAMADAIYEVHHGLRSTGSRPWSGSDTDDLKRRIVDGITRAERFLEDAATHRDLLRWARELVAATLLPNSGHLHAVHGDLHLGQLLRESTNQHIQYRVIDFEGEPLASPDERKAWHSPMKDVAGMLRSFDYAVGFARKAGAPGDDTEWSAWLRECEKTFLGRYWAHEPDSGVDRIETDRLLALAVVEKALYEIAYEAASRPDWIDIPLGGLSRALDRLRAAVRE